MYCHILCVCAILACIAYDSHVATFSVVVGISCAGQWVFLCREVPNLSYIHQRKTQTEVVESLARMTVAVWHSYRVHAFFLVSSFM